MGVIVLSSNYLVQFPINHYGLNEILTYGAFTYPIAFLITDLANRSYGKLIAQKIVYLGFFIGVGSTILFSTNFQDLIDQANKEKEIELKYDLERNVKLVSFNQRTIDISFNEKLNKNFIKNLTEKLLVWTGERWIISLSKNINAKSVYEKNLEDRTSKINEFKQSKIAQDIQKVFPDAKLIDLKEEK